MIHGVCVCVCVLFQILFHYRLLLDIKYNSLCYTVGPCLSILYIYSNVALVFKKDFPDDFNMFPGLKTTGVDVLFYLLL